MSKKHKEITRAFYEDVIAKADVSRLAEFCRDNVTFRSSLGHLKQGMDGLAEFMVTTGSALSDFECHIDDILSERNKVCARITFSGTHDLGDLLLFKPSGAPVVWEGVAVITFKGEKIADIWTLGDVHSLLKQLAASSTETPG